MMLSSFTGTCTLPDVVCRHSRSCVGLPTHTYESHGDSENIIIIPYLSIFYMYLGFILWDIMRSHLFQPKKLVEQNHGTSMYIFFPSLSNCYRNTTNTVYMYNVYSTWHFITISLSASNCGNSSMVLFSLIPYGSKHSCMYYCSGESKYRVLCLMGWQWLTKTLEMTEVLNKMIVRLLIQCDARTETKIRMHHVQCSRSWPRLVWQVNWFKLMLERNSSINTMLSRCFNHAHQLDLNPSRRATSQPRGCLWCIQKVRRHGLIII